MNQLKERTSLPTKAASLVPPVPAFDKVLGGIKGHRIATVSTPGNRLQNQGAGSQQIADGAVTTAKIASAAITQSRLSFETATITIANAATSGTASVTASDAILGYYISTISGAAATPGIVRLGISGTTLTITLGTAPGAGTSITFIVQLLKI